MSVLASLGGGHLNYLAGATLEHDEAVFAESGTLHRESGGGTGVAGFEVCILYIAHDVRCRYLGCGVI